MSDFFQQLRLAVRSLWRAPVLTVAAILCLALGIGPNSAVFSLVDAVLLAPLPYEEPDEVVLLWGGDGREGGTKLPLSLPEFHDLLGSLDSLESVAAVGPQLLNITGDERPERLIVARGSEGVFDLLGITPATGRLFVADDHRPDAPAVAVLGHELWRERFGSDRQVLDRVVRLNDQPTRVVGVLPRDFRFGSLSYEIWLPMVDSPSLPPRQARFLTVVGRRADGVSPEQVDEELAIAATETTRLHPDVYPADGEWTLSAVPARQDLVGDVRPVLLFLLLTVGLVLLIACANVANLLLTRALGRQKEVAIRSALGAGHRDLLRQFLLESVLLALAGGLLGLLFAQWALGTLLAVHADAVPRSEEVALDPGVLLFTLGLALVTGLLFGLLPALRATRFDLRGVLQHGGKTSGGAGSGGRLRTGLVVMEVALALVVLVGGVLMVQSFARLLEVDPGYRSEGVLSLQISLSRLDAPENHQVVAFFQRLVEQLEATPGVRTAAVVSHLPAGGFELSGEVEPEGWLAGSDGARPSTGWRIVGPGYFETLGIPLEQGRVLEDGDHDRAPEVVVVDRELAERLWPDENPVGKRLRLDATRPDTQDWRQVVGVVGHVRHRLTGGGSPDQLYLPLAQYPTRIMSVVLRTEGSPETMIPRVREVVAGLDPDLPVEDIMAMDERLADSIARPRLTGFLFGTFAAVALLLAVLGLYGVISESAARRAQEIGIRLALGAHRWDVVRMVVGRGLAVAAVGIAAGLVGALLVGWLLEGLLYGVSTADVSTYVIVSATLLAVAGLASLVPAWRASRIDPIRALRSE